MTGKASRSGGARAGAGRKPRSFRLKLGDKLFVRHGLADGTGTLGDVAEVTAVTRTFLTLAIQDENGQATGEVVNLLR